MRLNNGFNPTYCRRFSTSGCVAGNGRVLSSKNNKAHFTISKISLGCEAEAKTASLMRCEEVDRSVAMKNVVYFFRSN